VVQRIHMNSALAGLLSSVLEGLAVLGKTTKHFREPNSFEREIVARTIICVRMGVETAFQIPDGDACRSSWAIIFREGIK
jgi:hypothetical protein